MAARPYHHLQARDQLVTKIKKIEGNVLTLAHAPGRSVEGAVVRHCDSDTLQAIVSRAVREGRNVFLPTGHYRLMRGVTVANPAGTVIEGASGAETLLDISEGFGSCVSLAGGSEVTVRNLRDGRPHGIRRRGRAGTAFGPVVARPAGLLA